MTDYKVTIGIEAHVQLSTKTKLFSSVDNDARDAKPNTLISHIDVGMPGALPVLNEKAIELACIAAYALNAEPQQFSKFDRKHYFYPDLPKGYQITQYEQPIIKGGYVEIVVDGNPKKIGITRVHLEEDAGKNTHPAGADYSLVDLNRAGTPLLEIVSDPDITSPAEAKAYARELYLLMKYAGVSDVDLYLGHMRFDVNVSVSKTKQPGVRTETKNLNSFRSVEAAVEYEIRRQTEELKKGNKIIQETRGWDEAKQKTVSQRGKEEAHDYRYMPEPDIPPVVLDKYYLMKIKSGLGSLPTQIRKNLAETGLSRQEVESVVDNAAICEKALAEITHGTKADVVARMIRNFLEQAGAIDIPRESHRLLAEAFVFGDVSSSVMSEGVRLLIISPDLDVKDFIEKNAQISDESELATLVERVLTDNPKAVEDAKNGQEKAVGFLVGQVMAASKGAANPGLAQKIIKDKTGI